MPGGRPRTLEPQSTEELIKLGEELVAWAQVETKPPRVRMAQFYSIEKHILRNHWKGILQRPEFLPYYQEAQALLAARVMNTDVLDKSYGNRFIRLYDRDLTEEENETMRMKAELARNQKDEDDVATARHVAQAIAEAKKDA